MGAHVVQQLEQRALGHRHAQALGRAGWRGQALCGQRLIRPIEQLGRHVTRGKACRKPFRQREAHIAPEHPLLARGQIVAHALHGERALACHVQASDAGLKELDGTVRAQFVGRKGVHALPEPDQPTCPGVVGRQLRGDAQARERAHVKWRATWKAGLELLD